MRRAAALFAVALATARADRPAVAAGPVVSPSPEATMSIASGLALGRAVGRALVSFQTADMCAIPVLVPRCRGDFDAFVGGDEKAFDLVPGLGTFPLAHMRTYYSGGDPAMFPHGFATIRSATAPDALWQANPAAAWAMDEGILDETVDAALGSASAIYATPAASQMLRRVDESGGERSLIGDDRATADGHFAAGVLDRLARAIDARHPAAAGPAIPEVYGARGDVLLGIGFATVFQMCDAPAVAALPESQAFFDGFFAAAARASTVPDAARRLASVRDVLRFAHGYDPKKTTAAIADLVSYQNALPGGTLRRTLIGQFASQIGYNAAVQRDPGFLPLVVRHVTVWDDADAAFPGLARRRVALGLLDPKDFPAQRRASLALIGFLLVNPASK